MSGSITAESVWAYEAYAHDEQEEVIRETRHDEADEIGEYFDVYDYPENFQGGW